MQRGWQEGPISRYLHAQRGQARRGCGRESHGTGARKSQGARRVEVCALGTPSGGVWGRGGRGGADMSLGRNLRAHVLIRHQSLLRDEVLDTSEQRAGHRRAVHQGAGPRVGGHAHLTSKRSAPANRRPPAMPVRTTTYCARSACRGHVREDACRARQPAASARDGTHRLSVQLASHGLRDHHRSHDLRPVAVIVGDVALRVRFVGLPRRCGRNGTRPSLLGGPRRVRHSIAPFRVIRPQIRRPRERSEQTVPKVRRHRLSVAGGGHLRCDNDTQPHRLPVAALCERSGRCRPRPDQ